MERITQFGIAFIATVMIVHSLGTPVMSAIENGTNHSLINVRDAALAVIEDVSESIRPRYTIQWTFIVYEEPDFESSQKGMFAPQTVSIIQKRDDGWALIRTFSGDWWVYLRENRRFLPHTATLYESRRGASIASIGSQVVSVLEQDGDWLLISTWLGPKWIHLRHSSQQGDRRIALTFDDGPSHHTVRLLDELAVRNVPATFFVLGQRVSANPDLAARIVNERHEIASHSFRHIRLDTVRPAVIRDELTRANTAIYQATGRLPVIMRPPYGAHNSTVLAISEELGFPIIMWSVDTRDWESRDADTIMEHFTDANGVRIIDGDIILMHDIFGTTIDAAIRAIDLLLTEGFTFVTVSELLRDKYGPLEPGRIYRRG